MSALSRNRSRQATPAPRDPPDPQTRRLNDDRVSGATLREAALAAEGKTMSSSGAGAAVLACGEVAEFAGACGVR